jgi:hypothetical protein
MRRTALKSQNSKPVGVTPRVHDTESIRFVRDRTIGNAIHPSADHREPSRNPKTLEEFHHVLDPSPKIPDHSLGITQFSRSLPSLNVSPTHRFFRPHIITQAVIYY